MPRSQKQGPSSGTALDLPDELNRLSETVERLEQGLRLMLETQATQSELLRRLLEACAVPQDSRQPLEGMLAELVSLLQSQDQDLALLGTAVRHLPETIGQEVGKAVGDALRDGLKGL